MTSWGNQCTYSFVLFPFSLPDAADCPLKHPHNGKPQKGQSVTEGSDAHGGINRWGWVDDSRDSKHNEQIKRLCRLKCHSSSQRRQRCQGIPAFAVIVSSLCSQRVPRLRLPHAEFADAHCPPFVVSRPLPQLSLITIAIGFSFLSLHGDPACFHRVLYDQSCRYNTS